MVGRFAVTVGRRARRLHRDQRGTITILTVFAALMLTMLLGMVMNVGRQVDGKLRMQNAADAVAYSGGVVLARGMNSLAFTNQLLCEVFAMTAFMQEAHDRDAEKYVPEILAAWQNEAPAFQNTTLPKFRALGNAIPAKAQAEQALVTAFGNWAAALAGDGEDDGGALWLMRQILGSPSDPSTHMITEYQRAVVLAIPQMVQDAAMTVAGLNGQPDYGRGTMQGALWQLSTASPVDATCLAPIVIDTNSDAASPANPAQVSTAQITRNRYALEYLNAWNSQVLAFFDYGAKMSQFAQLWRHYTPCELNQFFAEYANTNLPLVIGTDLVTGQPLLAAGQPTVDYYESQMDQYFTFLGVVSWAKPVELAPGIYQSPITSDPVAFAEVRVFVPTSRLVWVTVSGAAASSPSIPMGGAPGDALGPPSPSGVTTPVPGRQGVDTQWDLFNQHWTCQLVPEVPGVDPGLANKEATQVLAILQQNLQPSTDISGLLSPDDLQKISYH